MNPKEADALGLAMGLQAKSEWVVNGVPNYATKSQIIHLLAGSVEGSWPGWKVRLVKVMATAKAGTVTWKIEAETEPASRAIRFGGAGRFSYLPRGVVACHRP